MPCPLTCPVEFSMVQRFVFTIKCFSIDALKPFKLNGLTNVINLLKKRFNYTLELNKSQQSMSFMCFKMPVIEFVESVLSQKL